MKQTGKTLAELIAGKNDVHPVEPGSIAGCTYCQPQVASVGMTEAEAKEKGLKIKVGRFPFIGNGKAIALGEPEGMVKTIFDVGTGELLGAHMVGAEVTELIQGYVVGRQLETTEEDLMNTVFPHPTLSEMMHESVLDAYGPDARRKGSYAQNCILARRLIERDVRFVQLFHMGWRDGWTFYPKNKNAESIHVAPTLHKPDDQNIKELWVGSNLNV